MHTQTVSVSNSDHTVITSYPTSVKDEILTVESVYIGYNRTAVVQAHKSGKRDVVNLGDDLEVDGCRWRVLEITSAMPGPKGGLPRCVVLSAS